MEDAIVGRTLLLRYKVISLIGRGGMADVYKVQDLTDGQYLAMKLLHSELAGDARFVGYFQREAHTLECLKHDNIVRFHCFGEEDGLVFLIIGLVEGGSLQREIFDAQGIGLTPQRINTILTPICQALAFAHEKGIIHCDLNPSNLLSDRNDRWILSDFGVARMNDESNLVLAGVGTAEYMAPEQIRGGKLGPQTDIYALGVLAFEMLTGGRLPYTGEKASQGKDKAERVLWEQTHLSLPMPHQYKPGISPELEQVVVRCLNPDSSQRFSSALDFLKSFEAAAALLPQSYWGQREAVDTAANEPDSQSARRDAPITDPFGKPVPTEAEEVEPSQKATPAPIRRRFLAGALLAVALLSVGFGALSVLPSQPPIIETAIAPAMTPTSAASITPAYTVTPISAPATTYNSSITILSTEGDVFYKTPLGNSSAMEPGNPIPLVKGTRLWTTAGTASLHMASKAVIYLGENTTANLIYASEKQNVLVPGIQLERGRVLVKTGETAQTVESGQEFYWGSADAHTIAGFIYDPVQNYFWVDCLSGTCILAYGITLNDVSAGSRAGYGKDVLEKPGALPYELWQTLAGPEVIPTGLVGTKPTATP